MTRNKKLMLSTALVAALAIGGGFYIKDRAAQAKAAHAQEQMEPQAMPVPVEIIKPTAKQLWQSFSGRLEAVDFAEIRPQVSGNIIEIKFEDGQYVDENDVLYVIDPRPFEAAVSHAEAELLAAQNDLDLAEKELKRAEELVSTDAISRRIFDQRANDVLVGAASVEAAKARLEQAQIDLDYAFVKAPIAGRVSRAEITEGNLVEAGPNAPILTTIVSSEGIYADFEMDEQTYLQDFRKVAAQKDKSDQVPAKIPVRLKIGSNGDFYDGFVHSFDNRIDASSGTIRVRAYLPNEDQSLLPGLFVSVEVGNPNVDEKIIITELAIGTNQDRKFVYVVDEENTVTYREVRIGESMNGKRVITDGLTAGDMVITGSMMRIRPGMKVAPQMSGS